MRWPILVLCASLAACSRRSPPPSPGATVDPTPAPAAPAPGPLRRTLEGDPSAWQPSDAPCPIAMVAPPAPAPGANLGQMALQQGHRPGQLDTNTVKSLSDAKVPAGGGDGVPVIYVEASRTDPVLDPATQSFTPGESSGRAYVLDPAGAVACVADVHARSSSSVTSMGGSDRSALMWLGIDLQFAIEREIVANAKRIAPLDAGARDAGSEGGARDAGKPKR